MFKNANNFYQGRDVPYWYYRSNSWFAQRFSCSSWGRLEVGGWVKSCYAWIRHTSIHVFKKVIVITLSNKFKISNAEQDGFAKYFLIKNKLKKYYFNVFSKKNSLKNIFYHILKHARRDAIGIKLMFLQLVQINALWWHITKKWEGFHGDDID